MKSFYDVDYLEVEIIHLPVTGLSLDFLYRFSKPIPCVLHSEPIKLSHSMTQPNNKSYDERLKEVLLMEWKKLVQEDRVGKAEITDPEAKALIEKLENISEVKLITLNLVRDEDSER